MLTASLWLFLLPVSYGLVDKSLGLAEEECPRIRRSWNDMSHEDRHLYIDGLMKIRENGEGKIEKDDYIAIASVHNDHWQEVNEGIDVSAHGDSIYFYWHGYFVWELEGRIRALGGKYKCFGMPYWDYTIESGREDDPLIFKTGLGGDGDPNDEYAVNGHSWKYDTSQFWIPFNCNAKNDHYPRCSLKRHLNSDLEISPAEEIGNVIKENPVFRDFSGTLSRGTNTANFFKGPYTETLVTSYDPTWYLLHSMISMEQALWTDCNDYDLISPNDLDKYPAAYSPYCKVNDASRSCDGYLSETQLDLDGTMIFNDRLKNKKWSYIHSNDLTVRKRFHMDRWNIIYDLNDDGNHDSFYEKSGLKKYCKGKLNPNWFISNDQQSYNLNSNTSTFKIDNDNNWQYHIIITSICILLIISIIGYTVYSHLQSKNKKNNSITSTPLLSV